MATSYEPHVYWDENNNFLAKISTIPGILMQIVLVFGGFWKLRCGEILSKKILQVKKITT